MFRTLVHILLIRPFLRLFAGITVIGRENLSGLDRFIVIANHNSHLDIFLLFSILPARDISRTRAVADKEYFGKYPVVHRIVRLLFDPVFISRGHPSRTEDPLETIRAAMIGNRNLVVFPEGTRGSPGELRHFKSGVGRLVESAPDIPVVPVFLSGPERSLPKKTLIPLPIWNYVVIGPPRTFGGNHRDITRRLEEALVDLSRSETSRLHTRSGGKIRRPRTIAFLGIDGSGKSTISRMIAGELSADSTVCLVGDGIEFFERGTAGDFQPFIAEKIRRALGAHVKNARSLKDYKAPKLAELLLRNHLHHEVMRWYTPDYIVMDGSPLLNIVAWAALYRKAAFNGETCRKAVRVLSGRDAAIGRGDPIYRQFPELAALRRLRLNTLALPDTVVFIDTSPSTACGRIDRRGEKKQVHETEEKLADLRRAYLVVCGCIRREWGIATAVLDGEAERSRVAEAAREFILTEQPGGETP